MTYTQEKVLDSYHRCEASGGFFDTFYKIFFAKSPEIPPKFADTDMKKQKQVVMASVLTVLRLSSGDSVARRSVEEIAESHSRSRHNIRPELYDLWLDALCEAVEKHDPEYTPDLKTKWQEAMQTGIEMMRAAY